MMSNYPTASDVTKWWCINWTGTTNVVAFYACRDIMPPLSGLHLENCSLGAIPITMVDGGWSVLAPLRIEIRQYP
jgi:hypothetical protein